MAVLVRGSKKFAKIKITWEQLVFRDPGYFFYAIAKGWYKNTRQYTAEETERIKYVVRRAMNLKIPGVCKWCKDDSPVKRMFITRHISGGIALVDFDCDKCKYLGGSLSIPLKPGFQHSELYKNYDKTGGKFLVDAIKHAYFGNGPYNITAKRADEFFDTPDNFHI